MAESKSIFIVQIFAHRNLRYAICDAVFLLKRLSNIRSYLLLKFL